MSQCKFHNDLSEDLQGLVEEIVYKIKQSNRIRDNYIKVTDNIYCLLTENIDEVDEGE